MAEVTEKLKNFQDCYNFPNTIFVYQNFITESKTLLSIKLLRRWFLDFAIRLIIQNHETH